MREFRDSRTAFCWKHYTLTLMLLSHSILGSPVMDAVLTSNNATNVNVTSSSTHNDSSSGSSTAAKVSSRSINALSLAAKRNQESLLDESVFGFDLDDEMGHQKDHNKTERRDKRTLYETWKKAKKIKLLSLGEASASAAKQFGKSIIKNIATLGIKAIIFNFLYSKINQVIDFKTRMLNNLEQKNREQNAQFLGIGTTDSSSGGISSQQSPSSVSVVSVSSTENNNPADQVPEFNPDKITLAIPDALFSPSFSLANGISQVLGTLIQNKANRIARMFEALKPFLRSSVGIHSKNRPSRNELSDDFDDHKNADKRRFSNTNDLNDDSSDDTPIKTSYSALTG